MYTLKNLPKNYLELSNLNLCSNKILGGGFPFAFGEGLPLIIGNSNGNVPSIWLQAIKNHKNKELIVLIDENISLVKEVSISKPESGVIEVFFKQDIKILRIKKNHDESAIISHLDLRPLGFDITGNVFELRIAGSTFSKNTVQGTSVFIGLG